MRFGILLALLLLSCRAEAQVFGTVRVTARDQQGLAISRASRRAAPAAASFAGTHYANPRDISVQVRYKFHY